MKLSAKGQITVPRRVRETLGVGPGDEVEFACRNGAVQLRRKVTGFAKWVGHLGRVPKREQEQTIARLRGRRK